MCCLGGEKVTGGSCAGGPDNSCVTLLFTFMVVSDTRALGDTGGGTLPAHLDCLPALPAHLPSAVLRPEPFTQHLTTSLRVSHSTLYTQ